MKSMFSSRGLLAFAVALAMAQFACGLGAQQPATAEPQATQPPAGTPSEHGSVDEAKAMLAQAVAHYNGVGRDQALKDFTAGAAPFKDRDLYVACTNDKHITTANGGFPTLVGVSVDSILTTDGKPVGSESWAMASATDVNEIHYNWTDPVTGITEPKTLFFQKMASDVCGVGVYTP